MENSSMQARLSTQEMPPLSEVGGKAASLIRLRQGGFKVPDGVVLTTAFFAPWIQQIEASETWGTVLATIHQSRARLPNLEQRERLERACEKVKRFAAGLSFDAAQRTVLDELRTELDEGTFAIRSSSPEEDLAGASFAGLYETVLNVPPDGIDDAVRTCFQSCLDARVLLYKREMDFDNLSPAIAVVIQRQLESAISGVVFSLNPLTNDFDEALINASWGLGEALVSGKITPDTVVVNKVSGAVIENRPGNKGGDRPDETCLSAAQIDEVIETVKRIEAHYDEPVDVEWAICDGELHVLQARPITGYVPLAKELQTEPGAARSLYMDAALTDGLTISGAISPITLDTFEWIYRLLVEYMVGIPADALDFEDTGFTSRGSRLYMNVSMFLHLFGKGHRIAKRSELTNTLMAEILLSCDFAQYRPARPPPQFRIWTLIRYTPRILWRMRSVLKWALKPALQRKRFQQEYDKALAWFDAWVSQPIDYTEPLGKAMRDWYIQVGLTTMISTGPGILYFIYMGTERVKNLIDASSSEQAALADAMCRGYPDDQIVQMGLLMFDLSMLLPESEFEDLDALLEKINNRELPDEFLSVWETFIERFGCRGPLEMELANPGYAEAPELALQQIAMIARGGGRFNPHDMQRQLIEARERAYEELLGLLPRRKRRRLTRAYDNILRFSGSRELIKHHVMQVNERIRQRLLRFASQFVAAGRLDAQDQIFDLTMSEIDQGAEDPAFDLRAAARARGVPYRKLRAQVRHFPMAIDSRGRILRPERKRDDGVLSGSGVSPGVARGLVKVLNDPFEKEVLPGEVLVAVTTDPGWTPLFINAAAVVLEIGGELQHGALVAREYGKPCVAGIADVTTRLCDGQTVEVDGNAGTVRIVDDASMFS